MTCPKCGENNADNYAFCIKCGTKLESVPAASNNNIEETQGQQSTVNPIDGQLKQVVQPELQQQVAPSQPIPEQVNNVMPAVDQTVVQTQNTQQPQMSQPKSNKFKDLMAKILKHKLIILIALVIIIALVIVLLVVFNSSSSDEYLALKYYFDPDKPIMIEKDDKYGFVSSKGKVILEPSYENATEFSGNYGVVYNESEEEDYENTYYVINRKGKVVQSIKSYSEPEYYPTYNLWYYNSALYNNNFKKISSEGMSVSYMGCGYSYYSDYTDLTTKIINKNGKKVFEWAGTGSYADIDDDSCDSKEMFAVVTSIDDPKRNAIVSLKNGKIIYSTTDSDISIDNKGDGLFKETNYDDDYAKYIYVKNNKILYQTTEELDDIQVYNSDKGILLIDYGYDFEDLGKSERYALYDAKNKKNLTYNEETVEGELTEQYYGIRTYKNDDDKMGIIMNDKVVVNAEYDKILIPSLSLYNYLNKYQNEKIVILQKDDESIIYNITKNTALFTINGTLKTEESSSFIYSIDYNSDTYEKEGYTIYNFITKKSIKLTSNEVSDIELNSNYVVVENDDVKTYYNTNFDKVYTAE